LTGTQQSALHFRIIASVSFTCGVLKTFYTANDIDLLADL